MNGNNERSENCMNDLQKIYCDGAAMAYRDVASSLNNIIREAPKEIRNLVECIMKPFADVRTKKADEVYKEAERMEKATRQ